MEPRSQLISDNTGFGLLGMILVIMLIMGSIFVTMMMLPAAENRQNKETQTKGAILRAAITAYQTEVGTYPSQLSDLVTAPTPPNPCTPDLTTGGGTNTTLSGWCGPYIDQTIMENANDYETDGWGTLFKYDPSGTLKSCGPNRICGDSDDLSF